MLKRRRRVIVIPETGALLAAVRHDLRQTAEIISAVDLATVEMALKLYPLIDAVIAERITPRSLPLRALALAQQHQPFARRVLVVTADAMSDVLEAVETASVNDLLFPPLLKGQINRLLGFAPQAVARPRTPGGMLAAV